MDRLSGLMARRYNFWQGHHPRPLPVAAQTQADYVRRAPTWETGFDLDRPIDGGDGQGSVEGRQLPACRTKPLLVLLQNGGDRTPASAGEFALGQQGLCPRRFHLDAAARQTRDGLADTTLIRPPPPDDWGRTMNESGYGFVVKDIKRGKIGRRPRCRQAQASDVASIRRAVFRRPGPARR